MARHTEHDIGDIQNPDDSEIVRYPESVSKNLERKFEAQAHRIMVHTNPGFEKTVNDALDKIKQMVLGKL